LSRLGWLVLGTLSGIVVILATFETSTQLVSLSQMRWDLLFLRLLGLHLLGGVHDTTWKKSEKYARAVETNACLLIDRASIEQPVPSKYDGG
jgi:hypothetical protein